MMNAILKKNFSLIMSVNEEQFSKELGKRIARFRKERGLTQQQLADSMGLKQYAIASYETGRYRMPVTLLPAVAKALDIEVSALFEARAEKKKPGPAPKLQQQMERISSLPREQQRSIIQVLDMALKSQAS